MIDKGNWRCRLDVRRVHHYLYQWSPRSRTYMFHFSVELRFFRQFNANAREKDPNAPIKMKFPLYQIGFQSITLIKSWAFIDFWCAFLHRKTRRKLSYKPINASDYFGRKEWVFFYPNSDLFAKLYNFEVFSLFYSKTSLWAIHFHCVKFVSAERECFEKHEKNCVNKTIYNS